MNANVPRFTSDIDHTIDRALSALRDAQPRSGLEGRLLVSLEHRTATPQPRGLHLSAHLALWTAASAAVLAIASLVVLHQHAAPTEFGRAPQTQFHSVTAASTPLQASVAGLPSAAGESAAFMRRHPERSASARSRRTPVFENCADHRESGCPHDDGAALMGGVAITPTDAQALADLHAPSRPAPPLPLTPQEKLFLRMLRYGNATQIAELNPLVRAKQDADETAAFKAFFPDPPPLQQSNGDTE